MAEDDDDDVLETKPELGREAATARRHLPAITDASLPVLQTYEDAVAEELRDQADRKTSLEQRGIAVITTAGALVTLLFGLGALSTRAHATFVLRHDARVFLAIALVLLVVAALLALATNFPLSYDTITGEALERELTSDLESREAARTRRRVARTRVRELVDAKRKNTWKAKLLFAALTFEVLGVAAVAITIWKVISP